MNAIVFDMPQKSPEWYLARAGKVTGSAADALLAVRKKGTGELAIRRDLRQRLVVERLTGMPQEPVPNPTKAMQHGTDTEPDAIAAYEAETGAFVQRVGFVQHAELQAGCSPDGYVGEWEGVIEAKCPGSVTHLEYLQADAIPDEYYGQLVHALWLTRARWVDFFSFDPRYHDPALRLFCKRLEATAVDLDAYELTVRMFLTEVDRAVEQIRGAGKAAA